MTNRIFIDTNILVYAYDTFEKVKQKVAFNLLDELVSLDAGVISTQVIGEFYVAVTKKIPGVLTAKAAVQRIEQFCRIWPVIEISEMVIYETLRGIQTHRFSYWDAQIWATAKLNQVSIVLSEDFSHDTRIEGVRFFNPLLADFKITNILDI